MRKCIICKKPMYSSNYSVWIGKKNFDAHKKCINKKKWEYTNE